MIINNTYKPKTTLGNLGTGVSSYSGGLYTPKPKVPTPTTGVTSKTAPQSAGLVSTTPKPQATPNVLSSLYSQAQNIQKGLTDLQRTQSAPTTPSPSKGLFSDVTSSLAGRANTPNAMTTQGIDAYTKAVDYQRQLKENVAQKTADIYSDPVSARVMQGRDQAMQQANLQKLTAAQEAVNQQQQQIGFGQAQQGLEQTALTSAGQLTQPVQVPFSNQYVDPTTGQTLGGGQLGGGLNVQSLAQQVISGQISPSQADSLLGNNLGLTNQLNQAILAQNPQFNRVEAEARAGATTSEIGQTGTTGGMLTKAADNATKAIGTLEHAYEALADMQKTQVPGWNKLITGLSSITGVGIAETQAYNTALQEARAAVSAVLSAAGNTPTFSDATASSILPDGAGPEQIKAAISTIQELIGQKVSSFTNAGQQQTGQIVNTSAGPINTNW